MNSHYIHSEPNQFNHGFHISLISHDKLLSDIMYQLILGVLSGLLCLADSLYGFTVNVPPVCLFGRNFQRNRRGMQPNVRGRVARENPTTTISQVFSFFYSRSSPTIYQFLPNFPFSFLNLFFSNSRIFSEMRIIHFKNIFSVIFRILKDRFKLLVLAYDYNKEGNQLDFSQCS